jgi:hypothetical protein
MVSFLALYRGASVASAELVAVAADPSLVAYVSRELLRRRTPATHDPVIRALVRGRRRALRLAQICTYDQK